MLEDNYLYIFGIINENKFIKVIYFKIIMKNYKIFIPSAGIGSRLKDLTKNINKALVKIGDKPTISYILEKFDPKIPIVFALGYQKDSLKEYLLENHPERTFEFVEIDDFDGPGSGLGLTVLKCEKNLQCPFIFISNDTIVDEEIPLPNYNWMGYEIIEDKDQYRCLEIDENDKVVELLEKKEKGNNPQPYIGLAGVFDYELFWKEMNLGDREVAIAQGESYGLRKMLPKVEVKAKRFTWSDTGTLEALEKTRKKFE